MWNEDTAKVSVHKMSRSIEIDNCRERCSIGNDNKSVAIFTRSVRAGINAEVKSTIPLDNIKRLKRRFVILDVCSTIPLNLLNLNNLRDKSSFCAWIINVNKIPINRGIK